ncbi:MAG: hypothetical protein JSR59_25075 [Proteobacteria bacterium]|nr:hypothetical protein [Pseudomonadota bacterium]
MGAFWHVLNFFAPALGLGAIAASFAKLVWRRELRAVRWPRLVLAAAGAAALVLMAGLVAFGRDGRMATYAGMVIATALALWWTGFAARRGP